MRITKNIFPFFILMAVLIIGITITAYADNTPEFSDMPDNWSTTALQNAVDNGLLTGYDGKIMPDANLTRAQMAAIIVRAFGASESGDISGYSDVAANAWYADSIAKAYQMSVINGSGSKMNPDAAITRQEVFVIIARALRLTPAQTLNKSFSDTDQIADWAKGEVYALANGGYIQGSSGELNPTGLITRAEFAQIMDNILKQYITTGGTVTTVAEGNIMVNAPGATLQNLTVSGDLIVGDGVGDGELILDNVKVTGRMVIRGGGENSIVIKGNSSVSNIIVSRINGSVSVKVEGDADVEVIYIDDGSDDVNIEGTVGNIQVAADNIMVTATNAVITNIDIVGENSKIVVDASSTVTTVNVQPTATATQIDVAGSIGTVSTTGDSTVVSGSGTVDKVEAQAGATNTSIETPNTQIVVDEGASSVTGGGGTPIESGTTGQNNNSGSDVVDNTGGGGGGGGNNNSLKSVVTRDPGNTGGDNLIFNSTTRSFSGTIDFYAANGNTPPLSGHYVGIQITAPASVTVDQQNATFTYTNAAGQEVTLVNGTDTWLDGENYVYYYPLVTPQRNSFTVVIDWDGNGTAYTAETIVIRATNTTLEAMASEPNDDIANATEVTVDATANTYWIWPETDVDWYKFTAEAGKTYEIAAANLGTVIDDNEMDTYLFLTDAEGNLLLSNDDYISLDSLLDYSFSGAGTYYAKVVHYDNSDPDYTPDADDIGYYDFSIKEVPGTITDTPLLDPVFLTTGINNISGTTEPNADVTIYVNDNEDSYLVTADINGEFSVNVEPMSLSIGDKITAFAKAQSENISCPTTATVEPCLTVGASGCDYTTISEAIAAAADGDSIYVEPGTYAEAINPFTLSDHSQEKSIILLGANCQNSPNDNSWSNEETILTGGMYIGYDDSSTRDNTIFIEGFTFQDKGLTVADEKYVTVINNKFIDITDANAVAILDQECSGQTGGQANIINNLIYNVCTNQDGMGINLRNPYNVSVYGNVITNTNHNSILIQKNAGYQGNNGNVYIMYNTITNWDCNNDSSSGGRAMRLNFQGSTSSPLGKNIYINYNLMSKTDFDPTTAVDPNFVKITGVGENPVYLTNNYWNGATPDFASILTVCKDGGATAAENVTTSPYLTEPEFPVNNRR